MSQNPKSKYDLFYFLDAIMDTKEELDFFDDDILSSYNATMIDRWLSMCEKYIPIVEQVACCNFRPSVHYEMYRMLIPKKKIHFNFIKKSRDISDLEQKNLCHYFKCGTRDLSYILQYMEPEDINEILKKYIYGGGKKIETS